MRSLALQTGERVLDVGCGPGRHAHSLAAQGLRVVGVDIAENFVRQATENGPEGSAFIRGDGRRLPLRGQSFDAAISLCQGGFGLPADPRAPDDAAVVSAMAAAVRPGGRLAMTAFSSYFLVRHLEEGDEFDAGAGVNREHTTVRNEGGEQAEFDLWTACYTPRELRLLFADAGLEVRGLWGVAPGRYGCRPPDLEHPELLVVAEKPSSGRGPTTTV